MADVCKSNELWVRQTLKYPRGEVKEAKCWRASLFSSFTCGASVTVPFQQDFYNSIKFKTQPASFRNKSTFSSWLLGGLLPPVLRWHSRALSIPACRSYVSLEFPHPCLGSAYTMAFRIDGLPLLQDFHLNIQMVPACFFPCPPSPFLVIYSYSCLASLS